MLIALPIALALTAHAAEVTALPPAMRADIEINYAATVIPDSLEESGQRVGERRSIDHNLRYIARYGFAKAFAVELELPHSASSKIKHFNSNQMVYDPILDTGTMVGTDTAPDGETTGKGAGGVLVRVVSTPLSEDLFSARGDQITWLLGLGYQFKDETNQWTVTDGERGAGPLSPGLEVRSFWSTTNSMSEPYLGVVWTNRFAATQTTQATNKKLDIQDPSSLDLVTGLEVELHRDDDWANGLGSEVALDLSATFSYQTWGDVVSGVTLPSVLSNTKGASVTQSETSSLWGAMSVRWRIIEYLDWTINTAIGGPLGYRLEHPYPVSTAPSGKLGWQVGTGFNFRMRDPMFDPK
jgi:hypothetical protein